MYIKKKRGPKVDPWGSDSKMLQNRLQLNISHNLFLKMDKMRYLKEKKNGPEWSKNTAFGGFKYLFFMEYA